MTGLSTSSLKQAIVAQRVHHGRRWSQCMPPFGPISQEEIAPLLPTPILLGGGGVGWSSSTPGNRANWRLSVPCLFVLYCFFLLSFFCSFVSTFDFSFICLSSHTHACSCSVTCRPSFFDAQISVGALQDTMRAHRVLVLLAVDAVRVRLLVHREAPSASKNLVRLLDVGCEGRHISPERGGRTLGLGRGFGAGGRLELQRLPYVLIGDSAAVQGEVHV